ncbi:hypothetical protein D1814_18115 [Alteromonas sp. BL110]|uniref:hypothetical protein n=1 Tax=Alteromonas sp. BL110 TaxID=1714845 RepID=UPI000E4674DC|nr:hypothetical protein [Alteromonas sp. BL110]AXT40463.1 hypothetical protein D1814_18115 [Alteromonas sp. BL110]RKM79696.1 hypothetical protein D7031_12110 [Alteromonas sp. BL110]
MSTKFKKALLALLILPASIHWLGITALGFMVFAHGTFYDISSFFVTVVMLIGLLALGVACFSVIRYPKISKFTIYSIGLGCASLTIALYMGLYTERQFLVSACSLYLGSALFMVDYARST